MSLLEPEAKVKILAPVTVMPPYEGKWPPDYTSVFAWRQKQILKIQKNPELITCLREYYKKHPAEFINHWCTTYDPRNAVIAKRPTYMPFILFKRQEEFVKFIYDCLISQENGLGEKSRDMGATWLCCCISVELWLFWPGASVGWGSRKQELVDNIGDPDSIFEKMRILIRRLPQILWPVGFDPNTHMTHMRIINPETDASITGEIGDNIGRGGRKLIYFKDESAHYEHPEAIEASLSDNTRCQIDISSVNGLGNVFHRRREAGIEWQPGVDLEKGKTRVFVLDWSEHPEKTKEWFDTRRRASEDAGLLHIFAQEVERDYAGAVEGVIIPPAWVRSAIDAHIHLEFDDSGGTCAGLDVADEGGDTNALAIRKGAVLKRLEQWGERDTGMTTRRAVHFCREVGQVDLQYDAVGVGAGVKGEANRLAEEQLLPRNIRFVPWFAGAQVLEPERNVIDGDRNSPLNKDFFANFKSQSWWALRIRFERTHRARNDPNYTWDADDLISLPSNLPLLHSLQKELSQPTMIQSARMKLLVDKKPEGSRSPNLADAVVMAYNPHTVGHPLNITADVLARSRFAPRKRRPF